MPIIMAVGKIDKTLTLDGTSTTLNQIITNMNNIANIKVVTLWTNDTHPFAAQTISIPVSSYDFILLQYKYYFDTGATNIKILTSGMTTQLTDMFNYNTGYFQGNRWLIVNSNSVQFTTAYNEVKSQDDNWYIPVKIIGIKL